VSDIEWSALLGRTGETFVFGVPEGAPVQAELIEAERADQASGGSISLLFRAENGIPAQGTYEVSHADLGTFALFVVPTSPRDFEAVITWLGAS
jgi:hypothetical protein